MICRYTFFVLALFVNTPVFSQEGGVIENIKIPVFIDTLFIDHDINNWSARVYTNYKDSRFRIADSHNTITYAPNNPFGIGIGIATRKIIIDFGINIKSDQKEPTERFDFHVTYMLKKHLFDYSLQIYEGFEAQSELGTNFRDDVSSLASGLSYLYMFNADEQSLEAMKAGHSRQIKFAQSFGLGGFVFINRIRADSSLVPRDLHSDFNEQARITNLEGYGAGVTVAYTMTYPFTPDFFISGSLTSGVGLSYKEVESEAKVYYPRNPMLYRANIDVVVGYNWTNFYINCSISNGLSATDLDFGNRAVYNMTNGKLALGYKFGKHK